MVLRDSFRKMHFSDTMRYSSYYGVRKGSSAKAWFYISFNSEYPISIRGKIGPTTRTKWDGPSVESRKIEVPCQSSRCSRIKISPHQSLIGIVHTCTSMVCVP